MKQTFINIFQRTFYIKIRLIYLVIAAGIFLSTGLVISVMHLIIAREDANRERRLINLVQNSENQPYQWKAKEISFPHVRLRRSLLVPHKDIGNPEGNRHFLDDLEKEIQIGLNWQESPPEIDMPHAEKAPEIDGIAEDEAWKNSLNFKGEYPLNSKDKIQDDSEWKLCWDENFIYFTCSFTDKSPEISNSERIYEGDSFELFIMPEERYHTYVELVFSPDGRQYTKWVTQSEKGRYEIADYKPESLTIATNQKENSFVIEGKIAFHDLPAYLRGNSPKAGEQLRLMMLRIDKSGDGFKKFTPVPFLYDGHNIFGYMKITLQKTIEKFQHTNHDIGKGSKQ